MSNDPFAGMAVMTSDAPITAADLEAEGQAIREALNQADALAAFIVANAQSEQHADHIEISSRHSTR